MSNSLPAISGANLMRLLEADGWTRDRAGRHGIVHSKLFGSVRRITVVPNSTRPLPPGTLQAILGSKQTGLGRKGLSRLIKQHGT